MAKVNKAEMPTRTYLAVDHGGILSPILIPIGTAFVSRGNRLSESQIDPLEHIGRRLSILI